MRMFYVLEIAYLMMLLMIELEDGGHMNMGWCIGGMCFKDVSWFVKILKHFKQVDILAGNKSFCNPLTWT